MADAKVKKDIEILKFKRDNILQKIDNLYTKAGSLSVATSPDELSEFKVRCERLQAHHESFERFQSDIAKGYIQLKETTELPALIELNKSTDQKYFYILAVRDKFFAPPVKTEEPEVDSKYLAAATAKLPKISLPCFDGTLKEWPQFKDLFVALVHENANLSDIEKFHFLISSTKGEPNTLVKSLPLCSNNYNLVWDQLNDRYDNKRLLASYYIEEILSLSPIHVESPKPLRNLLDTLNENTLALKQMEIPGSLGDFIILHVALKTLDKHTRQLFERKFSDKDYPSFNDLVEFLKDHCKSLEAAGDSRPSTKLGLLKSASKSYTVKSTAAANFPTKRSFHVSQTKPPTSCLFCSRDHNVYKCPSYLNLSPIQRKEFIKSKEACFNCLSSSHMLSKCRSTRSCFKCNKLHHTSLHVSHLENSPTENSVTSPSSDSNIENKEKSPSSSPTSALTCTRPNFRPNCQKGHSDSTTILLGTAVIQILDSTGNFQTARALIDAGSQSSFITEACAQRLRLPRRRHSQPILGLSETSVSGNKGIVSCILKPSHQDNPTLETSAVVLNRITSPLPSITLHERVKLFFQGWNLADPEFYLPGKIDFLIGADLFPQLFDGGRHDTPQGFPTAFHTIFGWLLIGETYVPVPQHQPVSVNLAILNQESLESNLKRFWEIEEPPMSQCLVSPEDEHCESIYASTVQRNPSGHFIVNLPFKNDPPDLGDSYTRAKNCLLSLERKFQRNPEFQSAYSSFMTEYEALGHMSKVTDSLKEAYYIPHHGIFKKNATASKLRVVFNASALSSSGKSLNDELLIGPKLQTDICKMLSLFRLHSYVFTTDIEKMYRQILVNPEQRTYQAILWRDSPEKQILTFLLNTVTYGVSSSPFLALRTLRQLASDNSDQYPLASEVDLNLMFVDDILTGGDSLEQAKKVKGELISLLESGGFQLRKWSSNSQELLEDVPSHHQELIFCNDKLENPSIKVLGLKWNPVSDVFSYEVHVEQLPATKRDLLSQVSKVYDPLGLITPVVLWAKCLIQKIWTLGLDWDQILPTDIVSHSVKFFENLPQLSQLTIPRPVLSPGYVDAQLHGFCDASEVGYGCAVYLRIIDPNSTVSSNLLMAKSKVAPLKKISIPRLELCGAVLLSKTMVFCQNILNSKLGIIPAFAWTDSIVTLHWIRSPPHQLKTFVANHVAELQTLTEPAKWRHTPTSSNPADYASRGLLPHEILDNPLWWHGPDWLIKDPLSWPNQPLPSLTSEESLVEFRPPASCALVAAEQPTNNIIELIENNSNFRKLQSCLGWILRFINNCQRDKEKTNLPYLTAGERQASLHSLVKITQFHHFQDQMKRISSQQVCPSIQRLDPFVDGNGILSVGGRLKNAQLGYDAKHPILLPKNSHLTLLLIDYFHVKYLHVGPRTLQSLLLRQFWIISARQVIRHRLSKCLVCTKFKTNSPHPYMGNLPESRLKPSRPFLNIGVDFGGPFMTKTDKLRKPQILKSYVCLFVCFSTKAVHLELVSSLSTEAFLACLDRFVSRRGLCANIYSDQATNFVGADRELQHLHNLLNKSPTSDVILSKIANLGISWHFNPPAAPHFGGLWESGIKSTKYHLKRVIGNQLLTFEEFSTLLAKVEAVLNSRPLCSLSPDPNEFETLTPGHFLIGELLVALPQADLSSISQNRLSRWQLVQQAQRSFWKVWSNDYLHQLQQRYKWNSKQPNLKINDLVLIKDKNLPPLKWATARIIATHPGKDSIVRVVSLKTPTGQLQRPVVQLCPLPQE